METPILSSPTGEIFSGITESDLFYRLTAKEVIHFREAKYQPSVVMIYCYIKTIDPFGNGLRMLPKQIAKELNYHHRTVSRGIKALIKAGELALALVEAHVKIVAKSVESLPEIVSKLGLVDTPTPPISEPPIPVLVVKLPTPTPVASEAPISMPVVETVLEPIVTPPAAFNPQQSEPTITSPKPKSGFSSVGNVLENMGFSAPSASTPTTTDTESAFKTEQWYDRIESRLNLLDIKLADVLHALKKYPIRAIEDAIAYTQKQTWATAKAGVFVSYLKKWTSSTSTFKGNPKSVDEPVVTALMKRFPEIASTLSKEQNPIDEATLDYLQRLRVAGNIYDMQYNSVKNFFGVFITIKDYPHSIPWWNAVLQLQQLYPGF
jgi:hypothetical protein